jgi:hypothetical protein
MALLDTAANHVDLSTVERGILPNLVLSDEKMEE